MLTALRQRRNHPLLHGFVLVLLLSWVALLMSATCLMPPSLQTAAAMSDCPAEQAGSHNGHVPKTDCSLKPCLASPADPGFVFGAEQPQLPPAMVWLAALASLWLRPLHAPRISRPPAPPAGRRIPLIYRYCTLLN